LEASLLFSKQDLGEITLYSPEVFINFHFCFQSLKYDILPPQTFKLWQFNQFGLFIPKMPLAHFLKKKQKTKNGVADNHLWGGSATQHIFIYFFGFFFFWDFFFRKKKCWGHLGNK
jgi:hypothetical protein